MLTKISEGRMDKDVVSLHHFTMDDVDDPQGRYVFTVKGPAAWGMGTVGAGAKFVRVREDRDGYKHFDDAEIDDPLSVPRIHVFADAHCMGHQYPQDQPNITLNRAVYEYGIAWQKSGAGDFWEVLSQSLGRADAAKMTRVGGDRIRRILQVARDLYMKVPDIEQTVTSRAIKVEMQRIVTSMQSGYDAIDRLAQKLSALNES